jgi:hypothetical protein
MEKENKMRLYDVEKNEYRELPKNESNFRSTEPGRCGVCHTISNEWSIPRNWYGSIRLICPGSSVKPDIHRLLWEKINGLRPEHPASVIKELEEEIKTLRLQFQGVSPNLVGIENWNTTDCGDSD